MNLTVRVRLIARIKLRLNNKIPFQRQSSLENFFIRFFLTPKTNFCLKIRHELLDQYQIIFLQRNTRVAVKNLNRKEEKQKMPSMCSKVFHTSQFVSIFRTYKVYKVYKSNRVTRGWPRSMRIIRFFRFVFFLIRPLY